MKYPNAAKGIKKIYLSEILSLVAAILAIGAIVLGVVTKTGTGTGGEALQEQAEAAGMVIPLAIYGVCTLVLIIVSYFLGLAGIIQARKDEESFKRALWVEVLGFVVAIVAAVLQNRNSQVAGWLNVASTVCTLMVTLLVLEGICVLADSLGRKDISDLGANCRRYLIGAFVLSAAGQLFTVLGAGNQGFSSASAITSYVMEIVAYVFYLRVLNKARIMQ